MIAGFESYTPRAWSDESGLILSGKPHNVASQQGRVRRAGKWNVIISNSVGGACLAISSFVLLTPPFTAETIPIAAPNKHGFDVIGPELIKSIELNPIHVNDQSFNSFFDSVRKGQMLISSDKVRLLAKKALQSQNESVDIDSWARNLANDIKDAND
jgi:hypothetical protein